MTDNRKLAVATKQIIFDHFILTKFNVPEPWGGCHKGLDEGWLERRFTIFEEYCLPSIVGQTSRNFQWLVFLDENTPERFRKQMDSWAARYDFLSPIYCRDRRESLVLKEMRSRTTAGRIRIMTNIDNDDAVHPRFVEKVQTVAARNCDSRNLEVGFFILFPIGYSENKGAFYLQRFRLNPFNSFVSTSDYQKSIFAWDHTKISGVAPLVFSYTRPMWMQVIHGENVCNRIRGIFWPFVKSSAWCAQGTKAVPRSFVWKLAEFFRSFQDFVLTGLLQKIRGR